MTTTSQIRRWQMLVVAFFFFKHQDIEGFVQNQLTPTLARHHTSPFWASRDILPSDQSSAVSDSSSPSEIDSDVSSSLKTLQPLVCLMISCLTLSVTFVAFEDYGATNLWPSRHMVVETTSPSHSFGSRSIHGLGFGQEERLKLLRQEQSSSSSSTTTTTISSMLPEIRAYNEVLEEHRQQRVSRWQQQQSASASSAPTELTMEQAAIDLQQNLLRVLKLQALVQDYQWDNVRDMIRNKILPTLEPAATRLRWELLSPQSTLNNNDNNNRVVAYEEVGFDWGSCAWRHCGALADAQEALDELDHLLGVLEPPEALFCLDVVERSIRDMLAVVPAEYHAMNGMPAYIPYQSVHASSDEFGDEADSLDQDYLRMLQELRSSEADAVDDE